MKKYIVAYTSEFISRKRDTMVKRDYWKVFIEEYDGKTPEEQAKEFYNELLQKETTYSANIAEIVESTDYTIEPEEDYYFDDLKFHDKSNKIMTLKAILQLDKKTVSVRMLRSDGMESRWNTSAVLFAKHQRGIIATLNSKKTRFLTGDKIFFNLQ